MRKLTLFLPLALLFLVVFCKKKDDPQPTVITIASPTAGQTIDNGDSVAIHATITAPTNIHGYDVWVVNTDSGDTIYTLDAHTHGTNLVVHGGFVNTVSVHTSAELTIRATIDHDGHYLDKKVIFHMHPPE